MFMLNGSPYPLGIPRVGNVTPFTYRSGATYLEILETMSSYIKDTLLPAIDSTIDTTAQEFVDSYQTFAEAIAAQITVINNKSGGMDIQRLTLGVDPFNVSIDPLWPSNLPVAFALTQDASGIRTVTKASNIDGAIVVATGADAVTEFTLVPQGNGRWYVSQIPTTKAGLDAAINSLFTPFSTSITERLNDQDDTVSEGLASVQQKLDVALPMKAAKTVVDEIGRIYTTAPIDVVYIGDSYFVGYQDGVAARVRDIPLRVTDLLNAQGMNTYRTHNYADAAQGYIAGSVANDYTAQVTRAIADPTIDNCRLIVIGGGRNDANRDGVKAKAVELYKRLQAKWPNARIIVAPMWSREQFKSPQRRAFSSIFEAARECGVVYDVNSLWINSFTAEELWAGTSVLHPRETLTQNFANAIYSMIQGGTMPAQTVDLEMRGSNGISAGVTTLDGFTVSLSAQHSVGATFGTDYIIGTIRYPVLRPGDVNQYVPGYAQSGADIKLWTIGANGNIGLTSGTAGAGLAGVAGTYPLGM